MNKARFKDLLAAYDESVKVMTGIANENHAVDPFSGLDAQANIERAQNDIIDALREELMQ